LVRVAHSLLLTSAGQVLSFGCAQYGQLGHGYSAGKQLPDTLRPKYIEDLSHLRVTCVSAGELHSAVVTSDGDVYSWGDGFCGQLGLGNKEPQMKPQPVVEGGLEDECVLSVSCGARHTLCVTEEGEVFSFGLGHFGVLGRSFTPYEYHSAQALASMGIEDEGEEQGLGHIDQLDNNMRTHLELLANLTLDDNSDQCIPKIIDSLQGVHIVNASAGHRHSLFLDSFGGAYACGSGFGPADKQEIPMKIMEFVDKDVQIMQISAGVDISMAVSTTGDVYSWGKTAGGRIGLKTNELMVSTPQKVPMKDANNRNVKAVDVECGYVHSMIIGCDGSLYMCGGVGTDDNEDGQNQEEILDGSTPGEPSQVQDFNIWHRLKEPKEQTKKVAWKKYGKYELKGRSAMKAESDRWGN
jgi:alpha-tubulin suppressor-like RCC1 family protein